MIELAPRTQAGERLARIADDLAAGAAARDAAAALKAARYFTAPIPVELGGLGVSSVHDLVVASGRLARGDASVALVASLHLAAVSSMERGLQIASAAHEDRRAGERAVMLERIAREGTVLAAAAGARGRDGTPPRTVATRTRTGWRIDGHEAFRVVSAAATHLYLPVARAEGHGVERYAHAIVPVNAAGVALQDGRDGRRSSASGTLWMSFRAVEVPDAAICGGFRAGYVLPYMEHELLARLFRAAVSLGTVQASGDAVALATASARLSRAAALVDEHRSTHRRSIGSADELDALRVEVQAARAFVNDAAARAPASRRVRVGAFTRPRPTARDHGFPAHAVLAAPAPL